MADYKLSIDVNVIIRTLDGAVIPKIEANRDYRKYLAWLDLGNTPDPADPIPDPLASLTHKVTRLVKLMVAEGLLTQAQAIAIRDDTLLPEDDE